MRKIISTFVTIIILCILGVFSLFIYTNAYEQLALTDLPYINSVEVSNLPNLVSGDEVPDLSNDDKYGFFGRAVTLRIPRLNYAVNLFEAPKSGSGWVVGKYSQSVVYLSKSKAVRFGDLIIFGQKDRKILQYERELSEGDRLVVETKDAWRYHFRVTNRSLISQDSSYLPAENAYSRIIILSEEKDGEVLIIEATYLEIEEI